ncbi:S9 family peptidase [Priestia taiwanensis]|uniref:Peptidase S9 n=1 Tax=Priestia taiwanensis TaxID=1347902 RepID=A0A917ARA8_9BACI|nr:S9 family peptidase [Priestia taiwanensis]MBM7363261.1 esterase/lipase [Priestia taiwanensis]GGE68966.1 peptidase S9 [Priestia taiwanensis]
MIEFPKCDAEQFFQTYNIGAFAVSKDEKRLIYGSNMNGKPNLWAIDLPNTYPYPLTYCNQMSNFIKLDSNGNYILLGLDHDGDENYKIHALRPEGGKPFPLMPAEKGEKQFFSHLSQDGERLYYTTSRDNEQFLNGRCYNLKTKEDTLLYSGDGATTGLMAVSEDEKTFILHKQFSNTYSLSYALRDGEMIPLTPVSEEEYVTEGVRFIDNDTVLVVTDYDADFAYVASFNLQTREFKVVQKFAAEGVNGGEYHKESKSAYIITNKGVEDRLYRLSLEDDSLVPMSLPVDIVNQLHIAKSGNVYVSGHSAVAPSNIFMLEKDAKEWKMLTNNCVLGLESGSLSDPETVMYESFDGLEIEALLFKPKEEVANGYTIFWPHGGPQWAERKQFRALFQYMTGLGYTVFAPNFRGSTCYGSKFTKVIEGDWGEGPRLDCVAGIEWLFEQGISDRDKLFVVGGSYGGYMTLLLSGRHSEYFRASVDIFGVSNLFTFIESVPEFWKPMMERWVGHPERDKEKLMEDSPITYLDGMVKPMLIIQGANDPRVVKAESDQMYEALKAKGRDVEYMVLEDEGHGFSKKENEIAVYRRIAEFLEKHQQKVTELQV